MTKYHINLLKNRTTLVRFVATDLYLEKIQAVFIQLSDVTRWKFELVTFNFVNDPSGKKVYKN